MIGQSGRSWIPAVRHRNRSDSFLDEAAGKTRSQAGFTVVEAAISMTILVAGLLGTSRVFIEASLVQKTTHQRAEAYNSCRALLEEMRDMDLNTLLSTYGTLPEQQEAEGPESESLAMNHFQSSVNAGYTMDVEFPSNALPGSTPYANVDPDSFGLVDLDLDGHIDSISGDVRTALLPVRVTSTWTLGGVEHSIQLVGLISER